MNANFKKLSEGFDVSEIVSELDSNPDLWNVHGDRTYKSGEHRDVDDIWVRYNNYANIGNKNTFNDEHVPVWYPAYYKLPSIKPIIFSTMAASMGEMLGGVLITRIPPGGKVHKHVDKGWHVDYYSKVYVQLQGHKDQTFYCGDDEVEVEKYSPNTGDIYLFDNRKPHWVTNDSPIDRITLIICIRTDYFGEKHV